MVRRVLLVPTESKTMGWQLSLCLSLSLSLGLDVDVGSSSSGGCNLLLEIVHRVGKCRTML